MLALWTTKGCYDKKYRMKYIVLKPSKISSNLKLKKYNERVPRKLKTKSEKERSFLGSFV